MASQLQWRPAISAEKFAQIAALHVLSQHVEYDHGYRTALQGETHPVQFSRILKAVTNHLQFQARRKGADDLLELEFTVQEPHLRTILEIDTIYTILREDFVESLIPSTVAEWRDQGRCTCTRKKKEVIPIYDRYPVEKKQETVISPPPPPTRRGTKPSNKKTKSPRKSPKRKPPKVPLADSDDDILPLSERLKLKREMSSQSSVSQISSSATSLLSDPIVSPTSVDENGTLSPTSTLSPSSSTHELPPLSPDSVNYPLSPDMSQTDPLSPDTISQADPLQPITVPSPEDFEEDLYIDSDVQLLPQSFMEEYLDLSRNEILGIDDSLVAKGDDSLVAKGDDSLVAKGDDSLVAKGDDSLVAKEDDSLVAKGDDSLVAKEDDSLVAKGDDSLVAKGDDSLVAMDGEQSMIWDRDEEESYTTRLSIDQGQYHTICFTTPAKPGNLIPWPNLSEDEGSPRGGSIENPEQKQSLEVSENLPTFDQLISRNESFNQPEPGKFQLTESLAALALSDLEETQIEEHPVDRKDREQNLDLSKPENAIHSDGGNKPVLDSIAVIQPTSPVILDSTAAEVSVSLEYPPAAPIDDFLEGGILPDRGLHQLNNPQNTSYNDVMAGELSLTSTIPDLSLDASSSCFSPKAPLPPPPNPRDDDHVTGSRVRDLLTSNFTPLSAIPPSSDIPIMTDSLAALAMSDLEESDVGNDPDLSLPVSETSFVAVESLSDPLYTKPLSDITPATSGTIADIPIMTDSLAALAMSDLEESVTEFGNHDQNLPVSESSLPRREPFQPKPLPDTSFLRQDIEVASWNQKAPLSAITATSTPARKEGNDEGRGIQKASPLPDIVGDENFVPNFNLNVTELLDSRSVLEGK
eukprot:sb/3461990/